MPIWVNTLQKSSSTKPADRFPRNLVCSLKDVCSNDDPGLTLTYFTARSTFVRLAFLLEIMKKLDFSETIAAWTLN